MKTLLLSSMTAVAALAFTVPLGAEENKPSTSQQQTGNKGSSSSREPSKTRVSLNQLPAAVQKTFRSESGSLNVENLYKLSRNGQTCYVGTYDKGPLKGQLTVGEDGSLLQSVQAANIALINHAPPLGSSEIKMSELPQALQSSLKQVAGTNNVGEISKVNHAGKTLYTAAFNDGGVHTELIYDEEGKLVLRTDQTALFAAPLRTSQRVSVNTAPKAVQNAIQQHASSDAVTDIDKGQWNGRTAYRVMVQKNGATRPILISETGEILRGENRNAAATGSPGRSEEGQNVARKADQQENK